MTGLSVFLIAVGLAMDAFSVAVAKGISVNNIGMRDAFKIALFFGVFQFIMPCLGWFLGSSIVDFISVFSHYISLGVLGFIGGKMIYDTLTCNEELDSIITIGGLTILAIATSIDALAVGVTIATFENRILLKAAVIGITAFILSFAGVYIGKKFGSVVGKYGEVAGGVVLIVIGLKLFIEHYI